MWPLQEERYRGWVGMTALVVLALGSIVFSVWGMLGFEWPNFFEAATPKTRAIVLAVPDCKECADPAAFVAEFESQGFVVAKTDTVPADSEEGKKLIRRYDIAKVPTVLLEKPSDQAQEFLKTFGDMSGTTFVLRDVVPPYQESATGDIKGRFGILLLTDASCKECYDPLLHKSPLAQLGMTPSDEKIIDISTDEGKKLVEQYAIETVPTLILQGDLSEYASLNQVWNQVGTIESDGAYVFRTGQDSMGTYRVIQTKEIKRPAP